MQRNRAVGLDKAEIRWFDPGSSFASTGGGKPRFVVVRGEPYQCPATGNHPWAGRGPGLTPGGPAAYPRDSS